MAVGIVVPGWHSSSAAQNAVSADRLVVDAISARISDESFWLGEPLTRERPSIVLYSKSAGEKSTTNTQVLAIVPDLNATYKFQVCGTNLILEEGWGPSIGTNSAETQSLSQDKYLRHELDRFSDFISGSIKSEDFLSLSSDPNKLFTGSAVLKAQRTSQIRMAAMNLFQGRGPLRMVVGDFSPLTTEIRAFLPATKQAVVFNVVDSCDGEQIVAVGRVRRLGSNAADRAFIGRIEAHGGVITIG